MSASVITITFTEDLLINDRLIFCIKQSAETASPINWYQVFRWVTVRSSSFQVTKGTGVLGSLGERPAINFKQSFEIDNSILLNTGLLTITRNVNVVTITAPNTNSLTLFTLDNIVPGISTDPSIEIGISNGSYSPFNITSETFAQAVTDPCVNVGLTIQTNALATKILSPVLIDPNTNNPFTLQLLRSQTYILQIQDTNGTIINEVIDTPSLLNSSNYIVDILNTPNGATVTINKAIEDYLNVEYSLDNTTWQLSNVFDSLTTGNYTLYVRDSFGCYFSKDFNVNEFSIYQPYFYISKSNSIRFAYRVDFNDAGNYKNDENTLSCEVDVKLPYKQTQLFQTADVITTQFKSNYENFLVKVIKSDASYDVIPIVKKTNNIGLKDLRDGLKYSLGNGKTGVYFQSGNIYDFDTNTDTGEDYSLNGTLPYWAKGGNYIKLDGVWYLIETVFYDEIKDADVIQISLNYTGPTVTCIAGSVYNSFDYEVYEFTIDMVNYMNQIIRVEITATDPNFNEVKLLSEEIDVKVKHENTFEINYWNDDNTDIFYQTEIKHKIRVFFDKRNGIQDDKADNFKTDTTAILISSEMYEVDEFIFEPQTKEIWRKLMIALSHKHVIIDGVGYVRLESAFDTDGPLEKSNLYVLKAKMIKTGGVFNSTSDGSSEYNYNGVGIPGLISTGTNNYLKY